MDIASLFGGMGGGSGGAQPLARSEAHTTLGGYSMGGALDFGPLLAIAAVLGAVIIVGALILKASR